MTRTRYGLAVALLVGSIAGVTATALAGDFTSPTGASMFGFAPKVPVSALARPAGWFDPSRLQFATSVTVGSGFGGGTQGLQVTSLSYHFKAPAWMRVNVGNAFGSAPTSGNGKLFLEGVDFGVQPFSSFLIQVHYRDLRSPLQYGAYSPYGDYSPFQRSSFWGE